jgi:predicted RND superfamily exporter protein
VISAGGMVIAFILTITLIPAWFSVVGMPAPWRPAGAGRLHFGLDQLPPNTVLLVTLALSLAAAWYARDVRFDYSVLAIRDKSSEAITTLLELQEQGLATDYSIAVLAEPDGVAPLVDELSALPAVSAVNQPSDILPLQQPEKAAALAPLAALKGLTLTPPTPFNADAATAAADALAGLLQSGEYAALARKLSSLSAMELAQLEQDLVAPLLAELAELRPRVLATPFGLEDLPTSTLDRLVAPDGRHRLEVIAGQQLNDLEAMDRFVTDVENVAPNIAGRTVVERGVGQSVVRSFNLAVIIALSCVVTVLLLYFREPLTPLLVLIPLGLTTLYTFAIIELTGLSLNMANILVVPLIFGLGVDTGIHVVHRYHHSRSVTDVLRSSTPRAVTLSALTTIGTFFSLSFSPHKGAASIGLILSIAIAILMLVTFIVLPALLARFEPLRQWGRDRPGHDS